MIEKECLNRALTLLRAIVSPDENCDLSKFGFCVEHGFDTSDGRACPTGEARRFLMELERGMTGA